PPDVLGGSLAREIERLANQYLGGVPGTALSAPSAPAGLSDVPALRGGHALPAGVTPGPVVPHNPGPSALAFGAGGASPAVSHPPSPGVFHAPPLAVAPAPKESDLRALPAMFAESAGTTPLALAVRPEPSSPQPYFLEFAGLPGGLAAPSPSFDLAKLQGPSGPAWAAAPGLPSTQAAELGTPPTVSRVPATAAAERPEVGTRALRYEPEVAAVEHSPSDPFDAAGVRRDFPILRERVHGRPLIWLDNAATTQKPQSVIDRLSHFYEHENSNIHRAAHTLAARATDAYEAARETSRRFLNAPSAKNIVFVRGTTEAINLVAQSWGRRNIGPGDEIVITWLEHHANIVPWQMLCREKGARLCVAPVDDDGQVILEEYERLLGPRTKLVAFGQVSNALGTIVPAREMIEIAHRYGARVLVDGAQAVSHLRVDTQALDCDFYCFSGHKIFGPTGIGVLYGKSDVLETMPPWQGGGNMIDNVSFEKTTYRAAPDRFEAGTGNIADAVGLGAALDYVTSLGLENIARHEHELLVYATERLTQIPGFRLFGTAPDKAAVLSFLLDGHRPEEVG
ncbi:MAG TPA: SufS family cysteine desulfurase, partial [Polyangiaceae bacterium]|nr:SufS family cysteine desulfurase [Polyangiaceae bacterium]